MLLQHGLFPMSVTSWLIMSMHPETFNLKKFQNSHLGTLKLVLTVPSFFCYFTEHFSTVFGVWFIHSSWLPNSWHDWATKAQISAEGGAAAGGWCGQKCGAQCSRRWVFLPRWTTGEVLPCCSRTFFVKIILKDSKTCHLEINI